MPRKPLNTKPAIEPNLTRRDTIGLRSIVKYDPMAPRPTTPVMVGKYVVARRPLPDGVYTLYMILDGTDVVQMQISYPSEGDCADAVRRHRQSQAASMAVAVVAKARTKRRAGAAREEVAA